LSCFRGNTVPTVLPRIQLSEYYSNFQNKMIKSPKHLVTFCPIKKTFFLVPNRFEFIANFVSYVVRNLILFIHSSATSFFCLLLLSRLKTLDFQNGPPNDFFKHVPLKKNLLFNFFSLLQRSTETTGRRRLCLKKKK
jgi:hypothetical protein